MKMIETSKAPTVIFIFSIIVLSITAALGYNKSKDAAVDEFKDQVVAFAKDYDGSDTKENKVLIENIKHEYEDFNNQVSSPFYIFKDEENISRVRKMYKDLDL